MRNGDSLGLLSIAAGGFVISNLLRGNFEFFECAFTILAILLGIGFGLFALYFAIRFGITATKWAHSWVKQAIQEFHDLIIEFQRNEIGTPVWRRITASCLIYATFFLVNVYTGMASDLLIGFDLTDSTTFNTISCVIYASVLTFCLIDWCRDRCRSRVLTVALLLISLKFSDEAVAIGFRMAGVLIPSIDISIAIYWLGVTATFSILNIDRVRMYCNQRVEKIARAIAVTGLVYASLVSLALTLTYSTSGALTALVFGIAMSLGVGLIAVFQGIIVVAIFALISWLGTIFTRFGRKQSMNV